MNENQINLSKEQEALIEKLGVVNEQSGLQPAAARIISLLLIADAAELTFEQIYNTLGISKSAASNAINLLLSTKKIEYTTKLGDRKRYFRTKVLHWQEAFKKDFESLNDLASLLTEVLKSRPGDTIEFNQKLKDVIDFLQFLHSEIPSIYKKWENLKRQNSK